MKQLHLVPLLALTLLGASCSGSHSTIHDGYAYQMSEDQAGLLVDSVIRSNIVSDRMLPGSKLVATGYDRSGFMHIDTQTYTATAIPVPRLSAYGFEVNHKGSMANGPTKAKRIFNTLNERAALIGPKVLLSQ
jgi:hypothetical protein